MAPVLTDQQKADATYVAGLAEPGKRFRLDLSDERQYRHAVDNHILAGQTPQLYPGLHEALALARDAHVAAGGPPPLDGPDDDGFQTGALVTAITTVAGTSTTGSTGYSTILGGAATLANVLLVKDQNGDVLAWGQNADHSGDGTYVGVETTPDGAGPVAAWMQATLQYTYQPQVGDPPIVEYVFSTAQLNPMADPVVQQPVKTQTKVPTPYLRIGLGRGDGQTIDVDYWFWQTTSNTTYAVPLVGYVDYNGTVVTPPASNVYVYGYLARGKSAPTGPGGGMIEISAAQIANIVNTLAASGSRLSWTLPAPTSVTDPGNPIVFVPAPWDTSEVTYFFIQFTANLVGQQLPGVAVVMSSDSADTDPLDGTATIPPIQFIFHCLAEGTQIALADGSTAAIESLTTDHAVGTAEGGARQVVSTKIGHHRGEVVRLEADGRTLVLSRNHLVLTPDGPRPAGHLAAGDEVRVDGGTATLTAAAVEEFDGLLCNASLSLPGEHADPDANGMLANGFLVCDYELQVRAQAAEREDPARILARLDPMFHEDYRNHQRLKAARAAH